MKSSPSKQQKKKNIFKWSAISALTILLCLSLFNNVMNYYNLHYSPLKEFTSRRLLMERAEQEQGEKNYRTNGILRDEDRFNKSKLEALVINDPIYQSRLSKAYQDCFKRPAGGAAGIFIDKWKKSAYCSVPKVGCTYWKNNYRFMDKNTGGRFFEKPADIPPSVTHYGPKMREYSLWSKSFTDHTTFLADSFRFMFVRHPIRRLWSAWIDKFLLADSWLGDGRAIAQMFKLNASERKCGSNVTFNQFLEFITTFTDYPDKLDVHWTPYRFLCDPCVFNPHLIGKMETFGKDAKVAEAVIEFESFLNEHKQDGKGKKPNKTGQDAKWAATPYGEDRGVREMKMLTDYTVNTLYQFKSKGAQLKACSIDRLFMAKRLWKTFQINGYIKEELKFPITHWSFDGWNEALQQAYSLWDPDRRARQQQQNQQKNKAMMKAYKEIPSDLLKKIQYFYRHDFSQFEYDLDP